MKLRIQNIFNKGRKIYLFIRNEDGSLSVKSDSTYHPYFYEMCNNINSKYKAYDGTPLKKIPLSNPKEVYKLRTHDSYSSDVPYTKIYTIDKIDEFIQSPIKYAMIDIECLTKDGNVAVVERDPISCITLYNSFNKTYNTWFLNDFEGTIKQKETQLINEFIGYLKLHKFDMLLGWSWNDFDYPYLYNRVQYRYKKNFAEMISPIKQSRRGQGEDIKYPAGVSQVDYMCVDEKTEILTTGGWKSWYEISKDQTALSYDLETEALKKTKINYIFHYDYNGEMYEIKNNRTNQLLTPNHRVLTITKNSDSQYGFYKFFEPNDLTSWRYIPLAPRNGYDGEVDLYNDDEIKLIGWIVTEGSWTLKDPAIRIAQSKPEGVKEIEEILKRLKLKYAKYKSNRKNHHYYNKKLQKTISHNYIDFTFRICSEDSKKIKKILQNKKELNYNLLNLSLRQSKILLKTLIKGDGTIDDNHTYGRFIQKDKTIASQVQELAIKCGFACSLRKPNSCHVLTISKKWITGGGISIKAKKKNYKGKVWCINTKLGTIVCRRNGQVFITGNCLYRKVEAKKSSYALEHVMEDELGSGKKYDDVDFSALNEDIKFRNIGDVKGMVELEEKKKLIPYYNAIRIFARVDWEDLPMKIIYSEGKMQKISNNSKIIDMLVLTEAKSMGIILPDKRYDKEHISFKGAKRDTAEIGRFRDISEFDLAGAYPQVIIDFCLDTQNIVEDFENYNEKYQLININGIYFKQNPDALLPTITRKLLDKKNEIKHLKETTPKNNPEFKNISTLYDAIKSVTNSVYGVFGLPTFRLFDVKVASSITYLVREVLIYSSTRLKKEGYDIIYRDTDGILVKGKENVEVKLNQYIQEWSMKNFGKNINLKFDYEGYYEKIFIKALCHYVGYLRNDKGIEKRIKGIEAKRSNATKFIKVFQEEFIDKVLTLKNNDWQYTRKDLVEWIKDEIGRFRGLSFEEIGFPCKLNRKQEDYVKTTPIFLRALWNTQSILPKFDKLIGQRYYWLHVIPDVVDVKVSTEIYFDKDKIKTFKEDISKKEFEQKIEEYLDEDQLKYLTDNASVKIRVLHKKTTKSKDVIAFDRKNQNHIGNVDWQQMIQKNILMKIQPIFDTLGWSYGELIPEKKRRFKNEKTN